MDLLSSAMRDNLGKGSWIRQMFEAGIRLKKEHGELAVCDFSLGNPDLAPPAIVAQALRELADKADQPYALGYMPNGGFPWARERLAAHLTEEQGIPIQGEDVILTCGAAGALNVFFKSTLNPGEEVLAFSPYFVEYRGYVSNHGGVFKTIPSKPETFTFDLEALDAAISGKTRALIINSPNNPTGQVYSREDLLKLVALLKEKSEKYGKPIFLIADEPYRFLVFDGVEVPSILPMYEYSLVASSFSKNLSLPGERIGFIALSPSMPGREGLMNGLIFANRILGYVNPPVVGQYLMAKALGAQVDASVYARRRDAMATVLRDAGYEFLLPRGAFYFFPKAPGGDDVAFVNVLMKYLVLAVPGSGFGGPGHFRLTFCVDEEVIYRAAEGFKKAIQDI